MDEEQEQQQQQGPIQPDGSYPRLNGELLSSSKFTNMVISMVGTIVPGGSAEMVQMKTCDDTTITLTTEHMEGMGLCQQDPSMALEIIGQAVDTSTIAVFVSRELSTDTDLTIYNQMIQIQHNPTFKQYFQPVTAGTTAGGGVMGQ